MRFLAFEPRGRFHSSKPSLYLFDLPVISCGFLIVIVGIILVSFVWPTLMQQWHKRPETLTIVRPFYPENARLDSISGEVVLSYVVDEEGNVLDPAVMESTPPGIFDEAALTAISQWKYHPFRHLGRESRAHVSLRMRFRPPDPTGSPLLWRDQLPIFEEQIVYGIFTTLPTVVYKVHPDLTEAMRIELTSYPYGWPECLVTFTVDETGKVTFPRLERPWQRLRMIRAEILTAVKQWQFKPATRDGKAVSAIVTQRIELPIEK